MLQISGFLEYKVIPDIPSPNTGGTLEAGTPVVVPAQPET